MRKNKILAFVLCTAMLVSMTACGDSSAKTDEAANSVEAEETEPAAELDNITYTNVVLGKNTTLKADIKFIHNKTDCEKDGSMQKMIAKFNEEYPGITVETEGITDYASEALNRLEDGNWGDVMFIPAVDKKDLSDYFMPLDSYDNLSGILNFTDEWEYGGVSYGIPYMGSLQGIVYNKSVFREAGITELPTTPTEFLEDLQLIKDKTDAIPLYTNYQSGWSMSSWDRYIGCVSNGDDTYLNQKLVHTAEPFSDPGDDTGVYNLYRILYDAAANGLIEDDYTDTDWETSKKMLNEGQIGAMVLGSWAYTQIQEAGENPEDVGYMPFPITVNGQQYLGACGDYSYAIGINSSEKNKMASMIFIKWMTEKSGWCYREGGYSVIKDGENPDIYHSLGDYTILTDQPAAKGQSLYLNEMNNESELEIDENGYDKVQRIVESAITGSETFDDIMNEWNSSWQSAQEKLGIEVLY